MVDGNGIPIGCVIAGANRNDSPLLALTLEKLGCDREIRTRGKPLQAGARWVVEAFIALANAVIIVRRLVRQAWASYRWEDRPTRRP